MATATMAPVARSGRAYAGYVLFLLVLVNMMNSADRSVINILVEPIRRELGFSDTEIGLISGIGFAAVYGLLGLPVARLADRGSRKRLLAAGLAGWSLMTVITGRAVGFWSMFVARFGVGAGEATCYPCALSLIADYFSPAQRPRAIAIFQSGLHVGFVIGAVLAGAIAERHGWRTGFTILGFPGVVLAGILLLTLHEPRRGTADLNALARPVRAGFVETLKLLIADRAFVMLALAGTFMALGSSTLLSWNGAYLMRSYGLSQSQVGVVLAPTMGLGGLVGTLGGGFLGTMAAKRYTRSRAPLLVMLWSAPLAIPATILFLLAPSLPVAIVSALFGGLFSAMYYGPLTAVALGRVRPEHRAMASSILILGQTVFGVGLGPLIAGAISDALSSRLGSESLRYAMLLAPVATFISCWFAFGAWRRLGAEGGRDDLR